MLAYKNGKAFEYYFINIFHEYNILGNSSKREEKLKLCYDQTSIGNRVSIRNNILKLLDKINIKMTDIMSYHLPGDCSGKKSKVSDIILYLKNNEEINLSCKNNNVSLKHQRPSSLAKQMILSQNDIDKYNNEYKSINDKIYNKFTKNNVLFNTLEKHKIYKMYIKINELVKKWLETANISSIQHYFNFLISIEKKYIIINQKNIMYYYDFTNNINLPKSKKIILKIPFPSTAM